MTLPIVEKLRRKKFSRRTPRGHRNVVLANADGPEAAALIEEMYEAGQRVLNGLNARIDAALPDAVPLFDGIAELHAALAKAGVQ